MMISLRLALAAAVSLLALQARADTIYLKNGDRITGTIVSAEGGKLQLTPDFDKSAKITIAQADIASFASAVPLLLKLKDGTVLHQAVAQGPAGEVLTQPGGLAAPQPVKLADLDKINPPPVAWTGSVSLNGSYGHADTTNIALGAAADGTRRTEDDRITLGAAYNYGEQKLGDVTSTNANNWFAQGKYDDFFTPVWYGYATTRVEADHVNYLSLRFAPGVGGGYQWIDRADLHFNTEAGASWIYEDYSNSSRPIENAALRLAYHLDTSWDDSRIKLFHDLTVLPTVQELRDFLVQTDAGVRTSLTKSMFSEVKVNLNYENHPPPGSRQLTSQLLVGVGLSY